MDQQFMGWSRKSENKEEEVVGKQKKKMVPVKFDVWKAVPSNAWILLSPELWILGNRFIKHMHKEYMIWVEWSSG